MNRRSLSAPNLLFAIAILTSLAWIPFARAETGPLVLEQITTGLSNPIFLCSPPGDTDRLFIIEENQGRIRIYNKATSTLQSTGSAFFDVDNIDNDPGTGGQQAFPFRNGGETGLLGLAFHPNYLDDPDTPTPDDGNGLFYIHISVNDPGHKSQFREFSVSGGDPDRADDSGPGELVLEIDQPYSNHNAGWIGFNPAATGAARFYLYVATGDGGSGNDPGSRAQDITSQLLGKMLRLDMGSAGTADDFPADPDKNYAIPASNPFVGVTGDDEIWAYGLRNPYRNSFDRQTGDLWIGDVGQNAHEEVDFQHASSTGGENYGWRAREGLSDNPNVADTAPVPRVEPILDYPRGTPGISADMVTGARYGQCITGGYVYRGSKMPWLDGHYFYADYEYSKVMSLKYNRDTLSIVPGTHTERTVELGLPNDGNTVTNTLAAFGEDAQGNLYLLNRSTGAISEITQNDWYLWRNQKFTVAELDDPSISAVDANSDGDDMTVIMEFVTGKNPKLADGPAPLAFTKETDGGAEEFLTLTLTRDPAVDFVDLTSESGANLSDFSDATTAVITDTPTMLKVRDTVEIGTANSRYIRFQFALPAAP